MKSLNKKNTFRDSISNKLDGKRNSVSSRKIKIKTISNSERQQLRISSYQYILP